MIINFDVDRVLNYSNISFNNYTSKIQPYNKNRIIEIKSAQREDKIYPGKTHKGENPNNNFNREIIMFNKRHT